MILNTVDCTRPNGGRLPQNVDLMMSDFAGGASGFPMTFFGGKYSGEAHGSRSEFRLLNLNFVYPFWKRKIFKMCCNVKLTSGNLSLQPALCDSFKSPYNDSIIEAKEQ